MAVEIYETSAWRSAIADGLNAADPDYPAHEGNVDNILRAALPHVRAALAESAVPRNAMKHTHRIRRRNGPIDGWLLVALDDNGGEGGPWTMTTARTIDDLLRHAGGLLPTKDDAVQICYYDEEDY